MLYVQGDVKQHKFPYRLFQILIRNLIESKVSLTENTIATTSANNTAKAADDTAQTELPPQLQVTGRSQTLKRTPFFKKWRDEEACGRHSRRAARRKPAKQTRFAAGSLSSPTAA